MVRNHLGGVQSAARVTCPQKCRQSIAASVASKRTPLQTPGWPLTHVGTSVAGIWHLVVTIPVFCYATQGPALLAPARSQPPTLLRAVNLLRMVMSTPAACATACTQG